MNWGPEHAASIVIVISRRYVADSPCFDGFYESRALLGGFVLGDTILHISMLRGEDVWGRGFPERISPSKMLEVLRYPTVMINQQCRVEAGVVRRRGGKWNEYRVVSQSQTGLSEF